MKRLIIYTLLQLSVTVCFGQFKVDSSGHVGMNATPNSSYICNIESNQKIPLRLINNTSLNNTATKALYAESTLLSYAGSPISVGNNVTYGSSFGNVLVKGVFY